MCENRKNTYRTQSRGSNRELLTSPRERPMNDCLVMGWGRLWTRKSGPFMSVYPPLTTLGLFIGQALSTDGGGEVPRCGSPTSLRAYGTG